MSVSARVRDDERTLPDRNTMTSDAPEPHRDGAAAQLLLRLAAGYALSAALRVIVCLDLAELLAKQPATASDLALQTNADRDALDRVLRLLAAAGVVRRDRDGCYSDTPTLTLLRRHPDSMRDLVYWLTDPRVVGAYTELAATVKTGMTSFNVHHHMSLYDMLQDDHAAAALFHSGLGSSSSDVASSILRACDFTSTRLLVDVGGGHGQLLAAILQACPSLQGLLLDTPSVATRAQALFDSLELGSRCEAICGDMFTEVPGGGDCYLLSHVLHNWGDHKCVEVLVNVRNALRSCAEGGTLVIVEYVVDPDRPQLPTALMDLHMLTMLGGRERTVSEFSALLGRADFSLSAVLPTKSGLHVLVGKVREEAG
jgi:hypothetical protein